MWLKHTIPNNVLLLSTNIRTFGYIIAETDNADGNRNFFERFSFEPNIAIGIFHALRDGEAKPIIAADTKGNLFIFIKPYGSGIFAIAKRLDISSANMSTIIRERLDDFIYLGSLPTDCAEKHIDPSLIMEFFATCDSIMALTAIPESNFSEADEYVFSHEGYSLFLTFIRMHGAVELEYKDGGGYKIFYACIDDIPHVSDRLEFMISAMDSQSLNLYYIKEDGKLRIAFLPYYIDDGKLGVKTKIEFNKYLYRDIYERN